MPRVAFMPSGKAAMVKEGSTILAAARRAGVEIPASCGSKGICGKCRVRVLEGTVDASVGHEHALSSAEIQSGWRLACIAKVHGDVIIETTAAPARTAILTDFKGRDIIPDGRFRIIPVTMTPPSLADQRPDMKRVCDAAGFDETPFAAIEVLQDLPACLRDSNWSVNLVMVEDILLGVLPGGAGARINGVAIDIGTTTIAGVLVDLVTGRNLAIASRTNPQAIHGDDVVSRIEYASGSREKLLEMRSLVACAINEIIAECAVAVQVDPRTIAGVSLAGNTTMHHLMMGIPPDRIGSSPFTPVLNDGVLLRAGDIGIHIAPGARAYLMPNVAGYVGGDITAGIVIHGIHDAEDRVLYVDVGTNGEMALRANGVTWCCSTAAGPAFEGARISGGMRAATGAISAVGTNDLDLVVTTIDDAPARGICGTGLLDAVAAFLEFGVVDSSGRIVDEDEWPTTCPPAVRARVDFSGDEPEVVLCAPQAPDEPRVTITQRDVRELQLAKGAVAAGIEVMLGAAGIGANELDRVILAGAFGSFLSPASARRVGLLPQDIDLTRIESVGNAALAGARAALLDAGCRIEARRVAEQMRYLELSGRADFQTAYMGAMIFPEPDA